MLYVREDIPAKLLSRDFPCAESFFVEINLYKKKWLINCSYNPRKNNIENHLDIISRSLDTHSNKYENIVLLGDFNACFDDEALQTLCKSYSLNSLIHCIDLMLTNKPRSFQTKCVIKTGLSDFHRIISVLKMHFRKLPPKVINDRDFKKLDNDRFMNSLQYNLSKKVLITVKTLTNFLKFVIPYLILMHPKRKSIYMGIINLSWLKPFQKLSCKEHVLETNF